MNIRIELDREDDGRWIAEALELPGVMTYADRIKHGEMPASALSVSFQVLSEQLAGD